MNEYDPEALNALANELKARGFVIREPEAEATPHEEIPPVEETETGIEEIIKHLNDCPDCYTKIWDQVYKPPKYECKDCGLPIKDHTALADCPNCHTNKVRKR